MSEWQKSRWRGAGEEDTVTGAWRGTRSEHRREGGCVCVCVQGAIQGSGDESWCCGSLCWRSPGYYTDTSMCLLRYTYRNDTVLTLYTEVTCNYKAIPQLTLLQRSDLG